MLVVTRRDFVVVFPLAAAAVVGCQVDGQRWIQSHLSVRASFQLERWAVNVSQPSPSWLVCWLLCVDKSHSTSVEIRRVWEIYDHQLQFMSGDDQDAFDNALTLGDVSAAWLSRSKAAATSLPDAFVVAGGIVPDIGVFKLGGER